MTLLVKKNIIGMGPLIKMLKVLELGHRDSKSYFYHPLKKTHQVFAMPPEWFSVESAQSWEIMLV